MRAATVENQHCVERRLWAVFDQEVLSWVYWQTCGDLRRLAWNMCLYTNLAMTFDLKKALSLPDIHHSIAKRDEVMNRFGPLFRNPSSLTAQDYYDFLSIKHNHHWSGLERLGRPAANDMDNLRAAILRPQLANLPQQVDRWATLHDAIERELAQVEQLGLIQRDPSLVRVGSSFQFRLPDHAPDDIERFVKRCADRGVELKWFGAERAKGFTSTYRHWAYAETPDLPQTDRVVAGLLDMRLPLTFSTDDCAVIAHIIREEVA